MPTSVDKREVVAWISDKASDHYVVNIGLWPSGGTDIEFEPKLAPYYEALRRGGDWHQDAKDGVPVFDDGAVGRFTWRAWGHLLAAIWSAEDRCTYTYMDFYMDSCVTDAGMELSPP